MRRRVVFFGSLAFSMACQSDYSVGQLCVSDGAAFDIEEVSELQDAAGYPGNRDAIVLEFDDSLFSAEDSWRVTQVDLLAMVPAWVFDSYEGGDAIRVEIWDSETPEGRGDWAVDVEITPELLSWEDVTLPDDAYWAGSRNELEQHQAWMSFDFTDVIPESGMTSSRYTVGVGWRSSGLPTIGYSNFNLPCSANYTDYGDGRWTLNSTDGSADDCSWPMMRIQVETRVVDAPCEDGILHAI